MEGTAEVCTDILEKNFRALSNSGALAMFPLLRYLPGDMFEYKRMKRDIKAAYDDYTEIIKEHRYSSGRCCGPIGSTLME